MTEKIASLDTNVLIYAFKRFLSHVEYPETDREMARRAKILVQNLTIRAIRVLVPAIVVAEYLKGIDLQHHEATLSEFRDQFEISPFDSRAAANAAKLWQAHRALFPTEQINRKVLKVDVLIVATAKAFGVTEYYSNDASSRRLAEQAGLSAFDLPEHSEYLIPDAIEIAKLKKRDRPSS